MRFSLDDAFDPCSEEVSHTRWQRICNAAVHWLVDLLAEKRLALFMWVLASSALAFVKPTGTLWGGAHSVWFELVVSAAVTVFVWRSMKVLCRVEDDPLHTAIAFFTLSAWATLISALMYRTLETPVWSAHLSLVIYLLVLVVAVAAVTLVVGAYILFVDCLPGVNWHQR